MTHLEKVVLQEVPHGPVCGYGPECVKGEVQYVEEDHQDQRTQLGLVTYRHQNHEHGAHHVLRDLQEGLFEPATDEKNTTFSKESASIDNLRSSVRRSPDQGQEHEDEEDPAGELHVLLGLVLAQGRDTGEKRLHLHAGFGQD